MHQFKTTAEMHSAGYAPRAYSLSEFPSWWMPGGKAIKTTKIEYERNEDPNLPIARIDVIEANLFVKESK